MRKIRTAVLAAVLAGCLPLAGCSSKGTDAEDWILSRYETMGIIEMYCGELDDVVGLYVAGGMTEEEYLQEVSTLNEEFSMMEEARDDGEIKVGSHTEETKRGQEGYEAIWTHLGTLTRSLGSDPSLLDANALAYFYMAYRDALAQDFEDYYGAYAAAGGTIEEKGGSEGSGNEAEVNSDGG